MLELVTTGQFRKDYKRVMIIRYLATNSKVSNCHRINQIRTTVLTRSSSAALDPT